MGGDEKFPSQSFLLYWRAAAVSAFGTYGIRPTLLVAAAVFALTAVGLALSPFRTVRAPG
jgi:hypothetical protein